MVKTDSTYKDIAENVETRFDTSNYEFERPLPKIKNKNVIWLMKDELDIKLMRKFDWLWPKSYSCLIDDLNEDKKGKGAKKCVIKRKVKFENHKNYLEATELEKKINYLEKTK